jgi:hypothetical protein
MDQITYKLNQILDFLQDPGSGHHSGDKKICYLTFPFEKILIAKKYLSTLLGLAKHRNYDVDILSLGSVVNEFIINNPRRNNWLAFSRVEDQFEMQSFFRGISSSVIENEVIETAILNKQEELQKNNNPLLFITDLEGIHPLTRFGPVEQKIYNQIEIPIIVLYPGDLSGSSLEFLGFYPPDGNYRSKHF